jgi:dihydroflavonol-4-reductase
MVLITGITGLVGSFVAKRFIESGHLVAGIRRSTSDMTLLSEIEDKIRWYEGDILDVLALEKAVQEATYVIHTAAIVSFAPRDRAAMFQTNIEGTANVVNACLEHHIKKLCFISSIASLGRKNEDESLTSTIITETSKWEESPLNSNYAKTKFLAEMEVWRGESEGLDVVIVNPSVILGEADWTKSSTQLFRYAFQEKAFYPTGDLNYVDVLDVAECVYQLTTSDIKGERFILNAGSISYKSFLEKVATAFGKKAPSKLVSPFMASILWRIEAIRSRITGNAPLLTKETALSASHSFSYPNDKIKQTLGFEFKSIDESIKRICAVLGQRYS